MFRKRFNRSFVGTGVDAGFKMAPGPSNCRNKDKSWERALYYFLCQTLVCTKLWFKRDLFNMRQIQGHNFVLRDETFATCRVVVKLTVEVPIREGVVEAISNMSAGKPSTFTKASPCDVVADKGLTLANF